MSPVLPLSVQLPMAPPLRQRVRVRREPEGSRGIRRIEAKFLPPPGFIAVTMELAVMSPA
jgi:hypothetical protein